MEEEKVALIYTRGFQTFSTHSTLRVPWCARPKEIPTVLFTKYFYPNNLISICPNNLVAI
jgi:hypothetical protein